MQKYNQTLQNIQVTASEFYLRVWAAMKNVIKLTLIGIFILISANSGASEISKADEKFILTEIKTMYDAYQAGDASILLEKTHKAVYSISGGKKNFERMVKSAISDLRKQGVKFVSATWGKPTKLYKAGNEEVCFVPRTSVIEMQGKRYRSIGFLIAIRTISKKSWSYLDGSGLRNQPDILWKLFPELDKNIELPANYTELF